MKHVNKGKQIQNLDILVYLEFLVRTCPLKSGCLVTLMLEVDSKAVQ